MNSEFNTQVVLVTGGSSGIGEAAARLFADRGARVGVLARDEAEVDAVTESIRTAGGEALALLADIARPEQLRAAVEKLVDRWGRLDVVFANAGVNGLWAPIDRLSVDEWRKTIDINLNGTFFTLKFTVPHLKKRGGAVIITASVNGTRMFSNSGATAYAASKAGQLALGKMLALELAPHGIRVNVICPGAVHTEIGENTTREDLEGVGWPAEYPEGLLPLNEGDPGQPRSVAELVCFLASSRASLITGTPVWIDGAESLLQG